MAWINALREEDAIILNVDKDTILLFLKLIDNHQDYLERKGIFQTFKENQDLKEIKQELQGVL